MRYRFVLILVVITTITGFMRAQEIFTARSYWKETTHKHYLSIKRKHLAGDSLSSNESAYLQDYEYFLAQYFSRLPDTEKQFYFSMKIQWNNELAGRTKLEAIEDFEWRSRDRSIKAAFGMYYGFMVVSISEIDNAAALGIPLVTGGLWMLGPVINPRK